jgi:hypothetical protein
MRKLECRSAFCTSVGASADRDQRRGVVVRRDGRAGGKVLESSTVEPTDSLRSIETALRLIIGEVLGEQTWISFPGAPDQAKLEERRVEEGNRRDGATVSSDLLDYTETYHLTTIIEKNWEKFQPVFSDRRRTLAFFGVIGDVRNSVAHSRNLVPFERDLISGIAGQLRNQVSLFRSSRTESAMYYPLIESITDSFGDEGVNASNRKDLALGRLDVGQTLLFTGTAFNAKGEQVRWKLLPVKATDARSHGSITECDMIDAAEGDSVTFQYVIRESDAHEIFALHVRIVADAKFHRHMPGFTKPYDDVRTFRYSVNPPDDY